MNTYYCVTSAYYDNGRVVIEITDSKYLINNRPESTSKSIRDRDIYCDWLTEAEIREQYPDLAKRYNMKK